MSLRRSYLSRRIIHRSFTLSRSYKDSTTSEIESICSNSIHRCRTDNDNESEQQGELGESGPPESGSWAGMLPELLGEIIQRVEASEDKWPQRRNVLACGCVCKRWRAATIEAVQRASHLQPGKITFPSSLKKVPITALYRCITSFDCVSCPLLYVLRV